MLDTEAGTIDTLPGTGSQTFTDEVCSPDALCLPRDVEVHDGWLYIADEGNNVIRRYDLSTGEMETVVGTFEEGDGPEGVDALEVSLSSPYGIDLAPDGSLLIADTYNHRIRKVTP